MLKRKRMTSDQKVIKIFGKKTLLKMIKKCVFTTKEYETLYSIYYDEMPYGTMKARTEDPDKFIFDRLVNLLEKK